jgi:hypothetical protein
LEERRNLAIKAVAATADCRRERVCVRLWGPILAAGYKHLLRGEVQPRGGLRAVGGAAGACPGGGRLRGE